MQNNPKHAVLVIVTVIITGVSGCQVSAADTDTRQPAVKALPTTSATQQLIIKFKPNTLDCNATGIARLSTESGVPLELVGPMSGNACLARQLAKADISFAQGQQRLKQHPAIEWVEQDALMKTM
jgi:hypothetical protein